MWRGMINEIQRVGFDFDGIILNPGGIHILQLPWVMP
jgi:hypothetical protein